MGMLTMRWIIVKCIQKKRDRIALAIALIGCIFVCAALAREGIHTVVQRPNALSEAKGEAIETNMPALVSRVGDREARTGVQKAIGQKVARREERQTTDGRKDAGGAQRREKVSLPKGDIVRGFGWQEDGGIWRYHTGIDIVSVGARAVCAAAGGTVRRIEKRAGGYLVQIDACGTLWQYEPLDEVTVSVGAVICLGEMIGRTAADADRLHIACRQGGEWIDPQSAGK